MTTTANISQISAPAKTYRLRRTYFNQGVGLGLCFIAFGVCSSLASYFYIDGSFARPKLGALVFGVFWSGPTLGAGWMLAAYYREQLRLEAKIIVQHGIFRVRTIEHYEVRQIRCPTLSMHGGLVVKTLAEQIKIHLDNFTAPEQAEIVQYFRTNFAEQLQENWTAFDACVQRQKAPPVPSSRRYLWVLVGIMAVFTMANLVAWFHDLGDQFLFVSIINIIAGLWIFWRQRSAEKKHSLRKSESGD